MAILDKKERNYRLADCCETCRDSEEVYISESDSFHLKCIVDGGTVVYMNVCDFYKRDGVGK